MNSANNISENWLFWYLLPLYVQRSLQRCSIHLDIFPVCNWFTASSSIVKPHIFIHKELHGSKKSVTFTSCSIWQTTWIPWRPSYMKGAPLCVIHSQCYIITWQTSRLLPPCTFTTTAKTRRSNQDTAKKEKKASYKTHDRPQVAANTG